jgi:hypothetical protein
VSQLYDSTLWRHYLADEVPKARNLQLEHEVATLEGQLPRCRRAGADAREQSWVEVRVINEGGGLVVDRPQLES